MCISLAYEVSWILDKTKSILLIRLEYYIWESVDGVGLEIVGAKIHDA